MGWAQIKSRRGFVSLGVLLPPFLGVIPLIWQKGVGTLSNGIRHAATHHP